MKCKLVDVFTQKQLSGNGLTIFFDFESLTSQEMLSLKQEMCQFESIFVCSNHRDNSCRAKIFTVEEELDFAGHPIIGLAAHLHDESGKENQQEWLIELNTKSLKVRTKKAGTYYHASMNQSNAEFICSLGDEDTMKVLSALNLSKENTSSYPMEVVSTGLPYLIVPITNGIEQARICTLNFEALLAEFGAKFVYVFDLITFEGRTWDNAGLIEDVATGSAAGPTAAYLTKYNLAPYNSTIVLSQGRFLGRPSEIQVYVEVKENIEPSIWVSGDVVKVANIEFV